MRLLLLLVACNHATAVPLPEAEVDDHRYHPSPFPHVEPNGIEGNWIHVSPLGVTTMLWTFRPDGSFQMNVYDADGGWPYQEVPGTYRIDGSLLTLEGPFAGLARVRMTEELFFHGDEVAAPVFHPLLPPESGWESKIAIEELDDAGSVKQISTRTDRYRFNDQGQMVVSVSVEDSLLSALASDGGWTVIADAEDMGGGAWDLSLPSVPSWNQLAVWGVVMAAPPLVRTY
jgi:hypothetical protein